MAFCLGREAVPVKRVWRGLTARLGRRRATTGKAGLGRLRKEVRTCEYSDVHVMWDLLSSHTNHTAAATTARRPRGRDGRRKAAVAAWSRLASYRRAL